MIHTTGSYNNYLRGCRCVNCKQRMTEYQQERKALLTPEQLRERQDRINETQRIRYRANTKGNVA